MQLALAVKNAKHVFLCGNGGSAANANHIANDLVSCGIHAHSLASNVAVLTCLANDFSYEEVFSRQLRVLGTDKDLLIVLSGSGNSKNVLQALQEARRIGMPTWAILGNMQPVGKAAALADHRLTKGATMQLAEEAQLAFGHEIMRWLKRNS